MKTVTITEEQMKKAFEYLEISYSLVNIYSKEENKEMYNCYLHQWYGMHAMINMLGLTDDYKAWRKVYASRKDIEND